MDTGKGTETASVPNGHNAATSPYTKFLSTQLILRDELAIDRTILANERTLLSYLRSGVALVIAGVSIMHFAAGQWFLWFGIFCIPSGIATSIFGIWRYKKMDSSISIVRQQMPRKQAGKAEAGVE